MPTTHRAVAVLVAVLWGLNFVAIHASLEVFPPFLCAALRFGVLAVPTLVLVPRPDVPLRWLLGYGVGFGVAQFAFLYSGMAAGMPAGLASLVLQASGPFTLLLGGLLLDEHIRRRQLVGILVAGAGMAVVGLSRAATAALLPFLLVLLGALGWGSATWASRLAAPRQPLRLALWMSVVPPLPMAALSLAIEGPDRIGGALRAAATGAALPAWLGLAYTVVVATIAGSGLWTWLLARHPAGVVAPFSMLVPVVGIATAAAVLGQVPTPLELLGAAIVVTGVLIGSRSAASKHDGSEHKDSGRTRPGRRRGRSRRRQPVAAAAS